MTDQITPGRYLIPEQVVEVHSVRFGRVGLLINDYDTMITDAFFAALSPVRQPDPPKPLEVGDRVKDEFGREWKVVAPKRQRRNGDEEYALWEERVGYDSYVANTVEQWERLP